MSSLPSTNKESRSLKMVPYSDDDQEDGDNSDVVSESSSDDGTTEICAICLRCMKGDIGSPDAVGCDHYFCLLCILEWAKNNATCPQDRRHFNKVLVMPYIGGSITEKIPVELKKEDEAFDYTADDLTYCEVCGSCEREDCLLLCDGCDLGYHLECLTPPLSEVPIAEWFCPTCVKVDLPSTIQPTTSKDENKSSLVQRPTTTPQKRLIPRTRATERIIQRIEKSRGNHGKKRTGKHRKRSFKRRNKDDSSEHEKYGKFNQVFPKAKKFGGIHDDDIDSCYNNDSWADKLLNPSPSLKLDSESKKFKALSVLNESSKPSPSYQGHSFHPKVDLSLPAMPDILTAILGSPSSLLVKPATTPVSKPLIDKKKSTNGSGSKNKKSNIGKENSLFLPIPLPSKPKDEVEEDKLTKKKEGAKKTTKENDMVKYDDPYDPLDEMDQSDGSYDPLDEIDNYDAPYDPLDELENSDEPYDPLEENEKSKEPSDSLKEQGKTEASLNPRDVLKKSEVTRNPENELKKLDRINSPLIEIIEPEIACITLDEVKGSSDTSKVSGKMLKESKEKTFKKLKSDQTDNNKATKDKRSSSNKKYDSPKHDSDRHDSSKHKRKRDSKDDKYDSVTKEEKHSYSKDEKYYNSKDKKYKSYNKDEKYFQYSKGEKYPYSKGEKYNLHSKSEKYIPYPHDDKYSYSKDSKLNRYYKDGKYNSLFEDDKYISFYKDKSNHTLFSKDEKYTSYSKDEKYSLSKYKHDYSSHSKSKDRHYKDKFSQKYHKRSKYDSDDSYISDRKKHKHRSRSTSSSSSSSSSRSRSRSPDDKLQKSVNRSSKQKPSYKSKSPEKENVKKKKLKSLWGNSFYSGSSSTLSEMPMDSQTTKHSFHSMDVPSLVADNKSTLIIISPDGNSGDRFSDSFEIAEPASLSTPLGVVRTFINSNKTIDDETAHVQLPKVKRAHKSKEIVLDDSSSSIEKQVVDSNISKENMSINLFNSKEKRGSKSKKNKKKSKSKKKEKQLSVINKEKLVNISNISLDDMIVDFTSSKEKELVDSNIKILTDASNIKILTDAFINEMAVSEGKNFFECNSKTGFVDQSNLFQVDPTRVKSSFEKKIKKAGFLDHSNFIAKEPAKAISGLDSKIKKPVLVESPVLVQNDTVKVKLNKETKIKDLESTEHSELVQIKIPAKIKTAIEGKNNTTEFEGQSVFTKKYSVSVKPTPESKQIKAELIQQYALNVGKSIAKPCLETQNKKKEFLKPPETDLESAIIHPFFDNELNKTTYTDQSVSAGNQIALVKPSLTSENKHARLPEQSKLVQKCLEKKNTELQKKPELIQQVSLAVNPDLEAKNKIIEPAGLFEFYESESVLVKSDFENKNTSLTGQLELAENDPAVITNDYFNEPNVDKFSINLKLKQKEKSDPSLEKQDMSYECKPLSEENTKINDVANSNKDVSNYKVNSREVDDELKLGRMKDIFGTGNEDDNDDDSPYDPCQEIEGTLSVEELSPYSSRSNSPIDKLTEIPKSYFKNSSVHMKSPSLSPEVNNLNVTSSPYSPSRSPSSSPEIIVKKSLTKDLNVGPSISKDKKLTKPDDWAIKNNSSGIFGHHPVTDFQFYENDFKLTEDDLKLKGNDYKIFDDTNVPKYVLSHSPKVSEAVSFVTDFKTNASKAEESKTDVLVKSFFVNDELKREICDKKVKSFFDEFSSPVKFDDSDSDETIRSKLKKIDQNISKENMQQNQNQTNERSFKFNTDSAIGIENKKFTHNATKREVEMNFQKSNFGDFENSFMFNNDAMLSGDSEMRKTDHCVKKMDLKPNYDLSFNESMDSPESPDSDVGISLPLTSKSADRKAIEGSKASHRLSSKNKQPVDKNILEAKVVEEAKKWLNPYYIDRCFTKDIFKEIMAKIVKKVLVVEYSLEIQPKKIQKLVDGYVQVYLHRVRKKKKQGAEASGSI